MRKNMFLAALSVCMLAASANVFAGEAPEQSFLDEIQGSYVGLFPEFRDDAYDAVWEEKLSEYAGVEKENAEAVKDAFLSVYESDLHGEEAWKKNVGEGETMVYMGQEISVAFPCDVYQSQDEAGEFNYFFLRDDTMEETGHIEFRYGKDLEELQGYFTGPYAYWLTAGFDVDADEETLKNTVELFVLENMDYTSHSEEAIAQLSDFVGTWNADLSAFGETYADTELYFTIDEKGHGITMMNGEQTTDFEAYAFDNGEKDDGAGIYIAYSNLENEAEAAAYLLETDDDGEIVLTLYAEDGVISYKKAA